MAARNAIKQRRRRLAPWSGAVWLAAMSGCNVQDSQLLIASSARATDTPTEDDSTGSQDPGRGAIAEAGAPESPVPVEMTVPGKSDSNALDATDCPSPQGGWASVNAQGVTTTTGGGSAPPYRVSSVEELQDLARDDTPRVLEFSGTFETETDGLIVSSNKTLRGVGKSATLKGGIRISGASNVILRNFTIHGSGYRGLPSDGVGIRNSHHIWLDHLAIREAPDGSVDITSASDLVTVSWTRFWYTDEAHDHRHASIVGNDPEALEEGDKNNVTFHHNWFAELVDAEAPRLLFGKAHLYNNYYTSEGNATCIRAGYAASLLVENNHFENIRAPHSFTSVHPGHIVANGNVYVATTGDQDTGYGDDEQTVQPFIPPYAYILDPVSEVPQLIQRCAGPQ